MDLQKNIRKAYVVAVFAAGFVIFLATQITPQTGRLSIIKPAGIAVFLIFWSIFFTYMAMQHTEQKWVRIAVVSCALVAAIWGSAKTDAIAKDLITGPQTVNLYNCKLYPDPNANFIIAPIVYTLSGHDENGTVFEFPITMNEYRSMAQRVWDLDAPWQTRVNGYLNSERIITFTAEIPQKEAKIGE